MGAIVANAGNLRSAPAGAAPDRATRPAGRRRWLRVVGLTLLAAIGLVLGAIAGMLLALSAGLIELC